LIGLQGTHSSWKYKKGQAFSAQLRIPLGEITEISLNQIVNLEVLEFSLNLEVKAKKQNKCL